MTGREPLDLHLDALGRELRTANRTMRGRFRRRGWTPALGAGSLAAIAAASVVVLLPVGGGRIDVVAEAKAALSAPAGILHYSITGDTSGRFGPKPRTTECLGRPQEVWRTTSGPLRWRMHNPVMPCAVGLSAQGRITTGATDTSFADRTLKHLAVDDGWMTVLTKTRPLDARIPLQIGGIKAPDGTTPEDPVASIKAMVAAGELRDGGARTDVDGRPLRRLVNTYRRSVMKGLPWRPATTEYFVDTKSFTPVVVRTTDEVVTNQLAVRRGAKPRFQTYTRADRFHTFEYIERTPATEKLLAVDPSPGVDVFSQTAAELVASVKANNRRRDRGMAQPSKAESQRAKKAIDAQIAAGTRRGRP